MQHRICRVQIRVQRRETASITDCDGFTRRNTSDGASTDRNAFAHARRNSEHNSITNADGANADSLTPVELKSKERKRAVRHTLAALFV
jgi:hypothetical protein